MFCVKITCLPQNKESIFFKTFPCMCTTDDIKSIVDTLAGLDASDTISIKQTSENSWQVYSKKCILRRGWIYNSHATVTTHLYDIDVIPMIFNNEFILKTSKGTQTSIKRHHTKHQSTQMTHSESTFDQFLSELKMNFGLTDNE